MRESDEKPNSKRPDTTTQSYARSAMGQQAGERAEPSRSLLPSLSLPKGGGAIRGIGEKFQMNVATGTASLSVPIATSAGRAGFGVALSLTYDSGSGNGAFGLGWALSVPQITRKTDRGLPRYEDGAESDVFILSGAEDLVPVRISAGSGTVLDFDDRTDQGIPYRVQRYRPRVEGLFARIERWTDRNTGDVHWRATTRENVTSIYGRAPQGRIADPDDSRRVFSWLLEETQDDRGNIARYHYKAEDGAGVVAGKASEQHRFAPAPNGARAFRTLAQRYLKRVEYGNHEPRDASAFFFEVVFDYGEHDASKPTPAETRTWSLRQDPHSSYRSGFEVRTYRLCRRVLMFHHFPDELGPEPYLVRSTDFGYREGPVVTYLERVTQAGYQRDDASGDYSRKELPTLECSYVLPEIHDRLDSIDRQSLSGIDSGVGAQSQWVDLDGEGIPGVLTPADGAWHYKENLGGGRLGPPRLQSSLPAPAELSGGAQLTDLGEDGNLDLVQYTPPLAGYFERVSPRGTEAGGWRPFVPLQRLPNIDWNDPNLRFLDVDGDGHPDIFVAEQDLFVWHRSRAKEGFDSALLQRKSRDERTGAAVLFADGTETIQLADMTGDGLTDIVRVRNREICYWPNLGYGRFGRKVTLDGSPHFDAPDQFDPRRIRFADIDGSGPSDIVYLGRSGVTLFLNQAGNALSEGQPVRSLPLADTVAHTGVVDLLGQGTACLVWSSALPGDRARPLAFVDLMGGKKPHLLERIENNLGGETRIAYAASTKFYLEDKVAGRPWITRLHFPVQVIERIEHFDRIARSKLITTHRYHHGFFDGHEREFRGFACVESLDAESLSGEKGSGLFAEDPDASPEELRLPPVLTKTWFHTGVWLDRERLESELAREYYAADAAAPALLRDTLLPLGLSVEEQRQAARALRGHTLRQEVYALDNSEQSAHPYTVSEQNYELRMLQRSEGEAHGVFFVHPRESQLLHYERRPNDPRIQQELTLAVDEFGNVIRSAAIAYPRRQPQQPEQARLWTLVRDVVVSNQANKLGAYRLGVPIETTAAELTGLSPAPNELFSLDVIRSAIGSAAAIPYEAVPNGNDLELRTVERQRTFYCDDASNPLPLGQLGPRVLLSKKNTLAFTPGLINQVYAGRIDNNILEDDGAYLNEDGLWWAPSEQLIYDAQHFFLPTESIDPFGNRSLVRYDDHALLVLEAEDALGNRVTAGLRDATPAEAIPLNGNRNDYRVLAPTLLTDANLNRSAVEYDELGFAIRTAVLGKEGAGEGDTLADPTVEITYDLLRYQSTKAQPKPLPIFVHTRAREKHGSQNTRFQESFLYSDGSGRDVMTKVQAEPDSALPDEPRRVGTGRTVFDNKGNPVKQYEPFFSSTFEYEDEADLVESGVTPILHYDPLGRLIRMEHPDGTRVRVEFDAWEQRSFDQNDTVFGSAWLAAKQAGSAAEQRAAALSLAHRDTPTVAHFDALGRPFLSVTDDGSRKLSTRTLLDIEGNALAVTDARGIVTLGQTFDILGRTVLSQSPDAGDQRSFPDVANKPAHAFTARGHTLRHRYDELQRATHLFVRDPEPNGVEKLVQRSVHGERHPQARDLNLRGQVHLVYDGAGVVENAAFDFKGRLTRGIRRLALEYKQTPDWASLATLLDAVAIKVAAESLLEPDTGFTTSTSYDALDRVVSQTTPDGSITLRGYNDAGLPETIAVRLRGAEQRTPFVQSVEYNARGQQVVVEHGNDTTCTYTYDPQTFRLLRQVLERPGLVLQDLEYTYDAAGNIVQIADGVSFGNPAVSADGLYEYDAIYQLVKAEGREHPGQQPTDADAALLNLDHPNDLQALERYREEYRYDEVGNILELKHRRRATSNGWTRIYNYASDSNRLLKTTAPVPSTQAGPLTEIYEHDDAGNMSRMPHLPLMRWDYANRLQATARQVVNSGTPETTYHTYDAGGARVRKVTERSAPTGQIPTPTLERLYIGVFELFREHETDGTSTKLERATLEVTDDGRRVALVESKTKDTSVPAATFQVASRQRYQVSNHLGSSSLELDEAGEIISYEEYHPFGAAALRAAARSSEVSAKRYRYTGKERDSEAGVDCQGARYYVAWLGRWTNADPAGVSDGVNRYAYVANDPIGFADPTGTERVCAQSACHTQSGHRDPELDASFTRIEAEYQYALAGLSPTEFETSLWSGRSYTENRGRPLRSVTPMVARGIGPNNASLVVGYELRYWKTNEENLGSVVAYSREGSIIGGRTLQGAVESEGLGPFDYVGQARFATAATRTAGRRALQVTRGLFEKKGFSEIASAAAGGIRTLSQAELKVPRDGPGTDAVWGGVNRGLGGVNRGLAEVADARRTLVEASRGNVKVVAGLDIGRARVWGWNGKWSNPFVGLNAHWGHAEIDALAKAYGSVSTIGRDGVMFVSESLCSSCLANIPKAATQMGLVSLTVHAPTETLVFLGNCRISWLSR